MKRLRCSKCGVVVKENEPLVYKCELTAKLVKRNPELYPEVVLRKDHHRVWKHKWGTVHCGPVETEHVSQHHAAIEYLVGEVI